jgi:hypothetical protein
MVVFYYISRYNVCEKKPKFSKQINCNGLHHFPLIMAFLELFQTFIPHSNGLDNLILNYSWHLSILDIDKWLYH